MTGGGDAALDFGLEPLGDYALEASARFIGAWHEAPADGSSATGHVHLAFLTDQAWEPVGVCLRRTLGEGAGMMHTRATG